jgi:lipoprotein-anchoring transpeptidase ErfK/SrfK
VRDIPPINHVVCVFIENKRYRKNPQPIDDVVNRNARSVYQTDEVLILIGAVQRRRPAPATRTVQDETVQSTSMFKTMSLALIGSACLQGAAIERAAAFDATALPEPAVIYANQPARPAPVRTASNMGGGFIEFLFGDSGSPGPSYQQHGIYQQQPYYGSAPLRQQDASDPAQRPFDPRYEKQVVDYTGKERAGTIVIDTPNKFLYLVQGNGKALRYGIGVGRPGFTWSGVKTISAKKEWPDWTPPAEMLARRPDLPRHMEGGPQNPLGARAMYLGSSLYRIHGSNEPWTIGTNVSSGCIRMRNDDVIDLYGRVSVGAKVVVI